MADDERPLVSVVLTTRDRPALFRTAVDSVFAQTYPDLELVVVDGSETPVAPVLTERTPDGTPLQYHRDAGEGPGAARNVGIEAATGDLVAFLDDDDRWHPDKIRRQVDALERGVGVVYAGQATVQNGTVIGGRAPTLSGEITTALLRGAPLCPTSTVLVRRDLIERVGGFDEQLPVWEDRDWYIRLSEHAEFRSVSDRLVFRRMGDHAQLTDDFAAARDVAYPRFRDKHRPRAAAVSRQCERAFVASLARRLAALGIATGHYSESRRYLLRALRATPLSTSTWIYLALSLGGRPLHGAARRVKRAIDGFTGESSTD